MPRKRLPPANSFYHPRMSDFFWSMYPNPDHPFIVYKFVIQNPRFAFFRHGKKNPERIIRQIVDVRARIPKLIKNKFFCPQTRPIAMNVRTHAYREFPDQPQYIIALACSRETLEKATQIALTDSPIEQTEVGPGKQITLNEYLETLPDLASLRAPLDQRSTINETYLRGTNPCFPVSNRFNHPIHVFRMPVESLSVILLTTRTNWD